MIRLRKFFHCTALSLLIPFLFGFGCDYFKSSNSSGDDPDSVASGPIDVLTPPDILQKGGTFWESVQLDGQKIGFQRTRIAPQPHENVKDLLLWEFENLITVGRGTQIIKMKTVTKSLETASGAFFGVDSNSYFGESSNRVAAEFDGNNLKILVPEPPHEIPWNENFFGPNGVTISLLQKPMQADEKRTVTYFEPAYKNMVEVELHAQKIESVEIMLERKNLLRIDYVMKTSGNEQSYDGFLWSIWTDANGAVCRMERPYSGNTLVVMRAKESEAVTQENTVLDISRLGMLPLNRPIENRFVAKNITYLIKYKNDIDPMTVFSASPLQQIRPISPDSFEVIVQSELALGANHPSLKQQKQPEPETLAPNSWIDFQSPEVRNLLSMAVPAQESDPMRIASILENFVNINVKSDANIGTSFASASETARTLSGDCTEYAVLLAALARAKGIPARVVLGLVYTELSSPEPENRGAMAFHLWNELYINGAWVPFDATLGKGGTDAARIRITESALDDASFPNFISQMDRLSGNLQVTVIDVQ